MTIWWPELMSGNGNVLVPALVRTGMILRRGIYRFGDRGCCWIPACGFWRAMPLRT